MRSHVQRLKAFVGRERIAKPAQTDPIPGLAQPISEVLARANLACRAEIVQLGSARLILLVTVIRPASLSMRATRIVETELAEALKDSPLHAVFWRSGEEPAADKVGTDPTVSRAEVGWSEHPKDREAITVHEISYEEFLRHTSGAEAAS